MRYRYVLREIHQICIIIVDWDFATDRIELASSPFGRRRMASKLYEMSAVMIIRLVGA